MTVRAPVCEGFLPLALCQADCCLFAATSEHILPSLMDHPRAALCSLCIYRHPHIRAASPVSFPLIPTSYSLTETAPDFCFIISAINLPWLLLSPLVSRLHYCHCSYDDFHREYCCQSSSLMKLGCVVEA